MGGGDVEARYQGRSCIHLPLPNQWPDGEDESDAVGDGAEGLREPERPMGGGVTIDGVRV